MIGARIVLPERTRHWISIAAAAEFAGYCVIVLFVTREFLIAVVNYLPAALFLFTALVFAYRHVRHKQLLVIIAGLMLTFIAAWIQTSEFGLHPVYFSHNALYHLIQALAMLMIFCGARWLAGSAHWKPIF
jgi:hypothetical protein